MELIIKAIVMGIVEGLTEFLPISSTGHLIITGDILNFLQRDQRSIFEISIQLGAILAVCWEYRHRLLSVISGFHTPSARRFCLNIVIAFVPAGVFGLFFGGTVKAYLFSPIPVAVAFVVGGLIILWVKRRHHAAAIFRVEDMTRQDALRVGFAQCLALIPGTSRSGATIIGGLLFGMSRKAATEFSFFLAIPTLGIATLYDLFQNRGNIDGDMAGLLLIGFIVSFASALFAVRGLLRFIAHHDFTAFAWYRMAFGAVVLITAYLGIVNWTK